MVDTFLGLEIKDWVTVAAIVIGPILAVQAQKMVERIKDKWERKLNIFKSLMSTRAERVSREHVQALNMIDIEFYGNKRFGTRRQSQKEKAVTNAWKNYNDHLNDLKSYDSQDAWIKHGGELFIKLLYEMSQALGYDFDEVQLKRDAYKPEAHVNLENAQLAVLNGWAKILNGEKSLPMEIKTPTNAQPITITDGTIRDMAE